MTRMMLAVWASAAANLSGTAMGQESANAAEQLYNRMTGKILQAGTVQVALKTETKLNGNPFKTSDVRIILEAPNRLWLKAQGTSQGKPEGVTMICDGTQFKVGDGPPQAAPETVSRNYRVILVKMGVSTYLGTKVVRNVVINTTDFKMGKKEKAGGVETQAVEYVLDIGKPEPRLTTTIWIDLKTELPVRRVTVLKAPSEEIVFTESMGGLKLDEKVDPKTFELPR